MPSPGIRNGQSHGAQPHQTPRVHPEDLGALGLAAPRAARRRQVPYPSVPPRALRRPVQVHLGPRVRGGGAPDSNAMDIGGQNIHKAYRFHKSGQPTEGDNVLVQGIRFRPWVIVNEISIVKATILARIEQWQRENKSLKSATGVDKNPDPLRGRSRPFLARSGPKRPRTSRNSAVLRRVVERGGGAASVGPSIGREPQILARHPSGRLHPIRGGEAVAPQSHRLRARCAAAGSQVPEGGGHRGQ